MAGNENSGRRGFGQEVAHLKETIKQEALEDLARTKVFNHINVIDEINDRQGVKEIALPVCLKATTNKTDLTTDGKPLILSEVLTKKHGIDNTGDTVQKQEQGTLEGEETQ